ncbi:MAG: hypothetical protein IJ231_02290 [Clostridia bacterium]|nr:hypothetical protein [Clostridia bacterium]
MDDHSSAFRGSARDSRRNPGNNPLDTQKKMLKKRIPTLFRVGIFSFFGISREVMDVLCFHAPHPPDYTEPIPTAFHQHTGCTARLKDIGRPSSSGFEGSSIFAAISSNASKRFFWLSQFLLIESKNWK